ncbi:MAG: thiol-disulfide oxidoreductase ResA [Nitrospinae bacterium CG11_big_fil_rev_8_21_14_0_20_56_8]|nr:MAG: thiol-disulfide oxidoreductase ResA [Nitrospinae bacterium CG11_big_fil_rev_8_21_14_0_20_56_8]
MKSTTLKRKDFTPIKLAGLFLLLFCGAILMFFEHFRESPFTQDDVRSQERMDQERAEVGYLAPRFTLRNLAGNRVDLGDFKGKVVVVNFWATWCAPCRVEMPSFESLYRRYRSEDLTVLAISIDKNHDEAIRDFVNQYNLSFPVLLDTEGQAERLYPSQTIPFTYVIGRDGRVVARVDGAKNWESAETFEAIEYLLKKS